MPLEIDAQGTRLKISAERSYLQDAPVGTFAEGLSMFQQSVSATAHVKFGETLVLSGLSGLSESVTDSNGSTTPLLGDLPVLGWAFNQRTTDQRQDAVLILVTPSRPTLFASQPWSRSASVTQLIALWGEVIDPATDAAHVAGRLSKMHLTHAAGRHVPGLAHWHGRPARHGARHPEPWRAMSLHPNRPSPRSVCETPFQQPMQAPEARSTPPWLTATISTTSKTSSATPAI